MYFPFPLHIIIFLTLCGSLSTASSATQDLVRSSCLHASYPNLCLRTLSSYPGPPKTPRDLAQATISVSLSRARRVSTFLSHMSDLNQGTRRQRVALTDCVEQISDSVDDLGKTLAELHHLRRDTFEWQIKNAETWISAALTNEDTCVDGFEGVDSKVKSDVRRQIADVAKVTSNALYLINRLDEY